MGCGNLNFINGFSNLVREISGLLIISSKHVLYTHTKNRLLLMPESGMRWC